MPTSWPARAAGAAITLLAATAFVILLRYALWRRAMSEGLSEDSELITTARGPIEFVRMGERLGTPVLWLHGNPGGYDQISRAFLVREGFNDGLNSIVVSRPGYLRTPLSSGVTPIEQAELYAALLDSLGIKRVAVVGMSGGGPSALQFARLYPERTQSLSLVFAIIKRNPPDPIGRRQKLANALGFKDWFSWRQRRAFESIPGFDASDTAMVRTAEVLHRSIVPRLAREAGDLNDQRQFDRPEGWPIDGIRAPTLVLAGTEDMIVPIAHVGYAKERIPGARIQMIEGDHNAQVTQAPAVFRTVRAFILEQARRRR